MRDHRTYTNRPRAHWGDTTFLLVLCVSSGVTQLLNDDPSEAASQLAPDWLVLVWSGLLTLGSAVTLVGTLWSAPSRGFSVEFIGRAILAPASLAYAVAIVANGGLAAALAAAYVAGFGVLGSLTRVLELGSAMGLWRLPEWYWRPRLLRRRRGAK